MPHPKIFLVGGPSGAGKDALLTGAREKAVDVAFVVRDVTRNADQCSALERSVSSDEFATGDYALRWSAHGTTDYGIPSKALEEALTAGRTIVLNVSRGTFTEARQKYADRADVYVLLVTASREALRQRLTARARDGDDAEARLKRATAYAPPDAHFGAAVVRVRNDRSLAEGVERFVAALERPAAFCVPVLGLVGCSASWPASPYISSAMKRVTGSFAQVGQIYPLRRAPARRRGGRRRGRRLLPATRCVPFR